MQFCFILRTSSLGWGLELSVGHILSHTSRAEIFLNKISKFPVLFFFFFVFFSAINVCNVWPIDILWSCQEDTGTKIVLFHLYNSYIDILFDSFLDETGFYFTIKLQVFMATNQIKKYGKNSQIWCYKEEKFLCKFHQWMDYHMKFECTSCTWHSAGIQL